MTPAFRLVAACCRWPAIEERAQAVRDAAAAITDWDEITRLEHDHANAELSDAAVRPIVEGFYFPSLAAGQALSASFSDAASRSTGPGPTLNMRAVQAARSDYLWLVGDFRLQNWDAFAAKVEVEQAQDGAALVCAAWGRHGRIILDHLEGEFAFAVWDGRDASLTLVRDALGRIPLHYAEVPGGVSFHTMPLPLARQRGHVRADLERLTGYLALQPERGPASFLEGIRRVIPGHLAVFTRDGERHQHRWWNPDLQEKSIPFDEAVASVRGEVDRAVRGAIEKAGPVVAAQLSGGLDSALVLSTAARVKSPKQSLVAIIGAPTGPTDPRTCGRFTDDAERALISAEAIGGMSVHLVRGDTQSPLILSRKDSEEAQRPFLNPCNSAWITATHYKAADCHAAVMLEGLLGNFTVSWDGFERFGELLRSFRWVTLSRQIVAFHKAGGGSLRGILQWAFALAFPAFMRTNPFQSRFLRPDSPWARRVLSSLRTRRTWKKPAETRLDWIEFVDPGLLQHVPRLQLGLDLRDPLAARPLVELCLRLPSRYFFDQGRTRRIARELLRDVVPESIAKEPRRGQQGGDWRAGAEPAIPAMLSLVERAADDDRLSRMFDLSRLAATLRSWPKDGWDDAGQVQIYRHDLIRAVCAIQWVFDVDKWAATAATGPEP